ncbi:MAG TPA: carboxyl transferase domain-containing protein [Solirubrobacterales bacterium]|nr:carboxyl transferase domain-containing protein [Solirubrobacterales bacterium]
MQREFQRLAIVNRGEPAMRLIHAVRELNEGRPEPIRLIALYTEPERNAMFVRHADEAFGLGSASFVDSADGSQKNRYLDYAALERALVATGAEAAWVGWGFVAEHPRFPELCERLGVVFVGPDADVMRRLGDKVNAKRMAEEVAVPVAPWSGGAVEDAGEAVRHAEEIGFPVLVKAAAGGGGRGIRRADGPGELTHAFDHARAEALSAFGDGTVLLEKLITPARHVEVQVIADGHDGVWAVGTRDCSVQRRSQKVIEESSSPALDAGQERELEAAAARLVRAAGYRGAATVEFLYQPEERSFSFMEVNARLQVEHPVTEAVTGLDLVKLQLHVAAGGRLEGDPPGPRGHAIEARLNAEDPALGFAPTPGRVEMLRLPSGPGLRVDTGIGEGDDIPGEFDSMVAKLIAWGADRAEAVARLRRALRETMVVLRDGTTNQGFLLELLDHPDLRAGEVDNTWLDRLQISGEVGPPPHGDVALVQAAVEMSEIETSLERARFYAFARRGRPEAEAKVGRTIELRHGGHGYRFRVSNVGPRRYRVEVDGVSAEAEVERLDDYERRIVYRGDAHRTVISAQGAQFLVEVDGVPHRMSRDDRGFVRSLAPGVVVSIQVEEGDEVARGEVVAVMESMKMENSLVAPFRGRVREVLARPNLQVDAQAPLMRLEPIDGADEQDAAPRVSFRASEGRQLERPALCREKLQRLEWLVLGYDVGEEEARRLAAELDESCGDLLGCDPLLVRGEHHLLDVFADLRSLTRRRHDSGDPEGDWLRSPQEYLHSYLRSLDAEAEGLPSRFVENLERALRHYGLDGLERTPALERACHRLFLSQERADASRAAVTAILDHRLERAESLVGNVGDEFREVLDRLIAATEHRDQVVADLAREVRFRYYDEPVIEAAREEAYAAMEEHLRALAEDPERADRDARVRALVDCPQPLAPLLTRRIATAGPGLQRVLVETMTRRYYRVRELDPFAEAELEGHAFLTTGYESEGRRHHLAVAFIDLDDLGDVVRGLAAHAATAPPGAAVVADIYAAHPAERVSHEELVARFEATLAEAELPRSVERMALAVAEPRRGRGMSAVDLFTFRSADGGPPREDESLRGLHPMMADRLRLWRFANFALERVPSSEDIYLFRGVVRSNPKDERLFAIAEVRDLTPVRDPDGRAVALPELERMLVGALEAIRSFHSRQPPRRRPLWNRVVLHAWPALELSPEEIRSLVSRNARATAALGIEMVLLYAGVPDSAGNVRPRVLRFFSPTGSGVVVEMGDPPAHTLQPLDESALRVIAARRRGTLHPTEIVKILAPADLGAEADQPSGDFVPHELDDDGRLVPVDRPSATNPTGIVVGLMRNRTERYPEGMLRVSLFGDPSKALGSLAEPECRRIIAALDLAEELGVPAEWFALSAGAKIAMDSGTENMDWIAAVLRRIVEYTQAGGELNVVVTGINVGAQPYWNAEATMLMHTRGILVMTPESAMVLTGKQALDFSGGVSAEDNFGIGGYERIMGPNGEAQYWAPDLGGACRLLLSHYEHTYVAPGERFPRRARTGDPAERDVRDAPHSWTESGLERVGDIFSDATNPGRKKPFDIRSVMGAAIDSDHPPLERWAGMRDAETAIVWEAHLGGWPVTLLGIESRPLVRYGQVPADGPERWTSGTLFPRSSKKVARAINAASGRQPVVVLANLSGFDGSPESMYEWQLEYGAEIGRAVVNFDGPIVFCVVSRYHGGAFVVFSQRLNEELEAAALEGTHASVIGGAPAAAVVFAREVGKRTAADVRIIDLDERIGAAEGAERQALRGERTALWEEVHAEKLGELADEFDRAHSVERALAMGSVSRIIPPASLRPYLIDAIERGMRRAGGPAASSDARARLADPLPR